MDFVSSGLAFVLQNPLQFCVVSYGLALLAHKISQHNENRRRNPASLPYPPGPKGYPFVGNMFDMPSSEQWRVYADWAKTYGEWLVNSQDPPQLNSMHISILIRRRALVRSIRATYRSPQLPGSSTGLVGEKVSKLLG